VREELLKSKVPKARSFISFLSLGALTLGLLAGVAGSPPHGLYPANGHQLFLSCAGRGQPTVVLESGLAVDHTQWDPVAHIAGIVGTQVCAYDRYGLGESSRPRFGIALTRTIDQAVDDLHALLEVAHVNAPYVLTGTSIGGLIVREYARRFPTDVVGMVLLDSAPDDWDLYTGIETFTEDDESFDIAAASAALRRSDHLGSRPLVVIEAGDDSSVQAAYAAGKKNFQSYWDSRQLALSEISTNSILAYAPGVAHGDIGKLPPGLTENAIKLVVNAARDGSQLPGCERTSLPALGTKCRS